MVRNPIITFILTVPPGIHADQEFFQKYTNFETDQEKCSENVDFSEKLEILIYEKFCLIRMNSGRYCQNKYFNRIRHHPINLCEFFIIMI
jgi:hypothetical protein